VLSKILLAILLIMLLGKLGLGAKLRNLLPRIDRAVNITLVVLVVAYVGQLAWWFIQRRSGP
jgi:hypothetical protein